MKSSNELVDSFKNFHQQKFEDKTTQAMTRRLIISELDLFRDFYKESEAACQAFFFNLNISLYTLETFRKKPEENLQANRSELGIDNQLRKFGGHNFENLKNGKGNLQKALDENGDFLKDCGLSDYINHVESLNKFICTVIEHLDNAKSEGLDSAVNLQEFKTKELEKLFSFIESKFNEIVVAQPNPNNAPSVENIRTFSM